MHIVAVLAALLCLTHGSQLSGSAKLLVHMVLNYRDETRDSHRKTFILTMVVRVIVSFAVTW